jgi:hypothetical protein
MRTAYRVRFPQWKDGLKEYFFTAEVDAIKFGDKFKKYGYEVKLDEIWFEEVEEMAVN